LNAETQSQGILYILVGPGGVGKNALMNAVLGNNPSLSQLATATTRAPREGEEEGVHHYFVTLDRFREMIVNDELLEHQEVHPGKFYGVPRNAIQEAIQAGKNLIADIEFKGATIIRDAFPENSRAIFIAPPSIGALRERLEARGASQQDIEDRLNRMASEMRYAPACDIILVNDEFESAVTELGAILTGQFAQQHTVNFVVSTQFIAGQQVLTGPAGDFMTLSLQLGEDPIQKIRAFALSTFDLAPGTVDYAHLQDDDAVHLNFDAEHRTLTISYHYLSQFDTAFDPPADWHWMTQRMEQNA
jgi:guanylate kinase